jgi:hypothetical protein
VSDLEPDVALRQRTRRLLDDPLKALETRRVFALLLVDDAETEQDLMRLVKVGREHSWNERRKHYVKPEAYQARVPTFVHPQYGRERLLRMVEGAIPIIQDADAIPQPWILLASRRQNHP